MTYRDAILAAGREYLQRVMDESRGKVEVAASLAGLSRSAFYRVAKRHGLVARQRPYTKRS